MPGEHAVRLRPAEAVDRLEHRQPSVRTQHAKELAQRCGLVVEVDHDRACRHDVDRAVGERQLVGRCADELAARIAVRVRTGRLEHVVGDVAEDHSTFLTDELERPEADQPFAAADVEHDIAVIDVRALKDAAAELVEQRL